MNNYRTYTLNENFFKTYSQDMAYILGLWYADGCIAPSPTTGKIYEFSITTDITNIGMLEKMKNMMGSNNELKFHSKRGNPVLKLFSIPLCQSIIDLGGSPSKSHNLIYPNLPDEYFPHFLRGYFDGDGCIHHKSGTYWVSRITCGDCSFLQGIQSRLNNLNPKIIGRIQSYKTYFTVEFNQSETLELGYIMYSNLGELYMERKFEKFCKLFNKLN